MPNGTDRVMASYPAWELWVFRVGSRSPDLHRTVPPQRGKDSGTVDRAGGTYHVPRTACAKGISGGDFPASSSQPLNQVPSSPPFHR